MTDTIVRKVVANESELNRDPITGTPGSHPLGTGTGAASGGVAGAVVGMAVGGPAGSLIGAAVGAVAGGLSGSSLAEAVNPTEEEAFWRETYTREPYYASNRSFEYYAPGFRAGWVQLIFDAFIFTIALFMLDSSAVAWSFLGALMANLTIAINHRRDRYIV